MTLREKTISGLKWSFVDNSTNQVIQFIIGVVLARLLTPEEYGIIGMAAIFFAISQTFIDSGFSQALIRKQECDQKDYSTIFYFNIAVGTFLYCALFICAPFIADFFKERQLIYVIRILGINLLISPFGLIQSVILIKNINFRLQTRISIIASVSAGLIAVTLAYLGMGIWSLVLRLLIQTFLSVVLLWLWSIWRPVRLFSLRSLRENFAFGSKLLASGLLDTAYNNIYYLVIGKFFSATELGYYTRANSFGNLPSKNIDAVVQRVSYPVLASIQDDTKRLKNAYRRLMKTTMFITFILMIGMAAVAKPMVLILIGEKWLPAVPYLQLLCFALMLYPLQSLNLSILKVKGRSDLFLKLELIKKVLAMPIIFIAIFYDVKTMILGMIVLSFVAYYINSYWSGKLIGYPVKEQILDIMPSFIFASSIGCILAAFVFFLTLTPLLTLLMQISVGGFLTISMAQFFKMNEFFEIREMIINSFTKTVNPV